LLSLVLTIQHFILRDACRSSGRLAVAAFRSLRWGRGLRPKALTRDRLLAEALGLLDRDGFEALTIRHLADHLGPSPMAPYNHVSSKQDLLQGIAQHVLTQTSFSSGHSNWRDGSHRGSAARDLPPAIMSTTWSMVICTIRTAAIAIITGYSKSWLGRARTDRL
jgi:AcrR family transcriptional regulator